MRNGIGPHIGVKPGTNGEIDFVNLDRGKFSNADVKEAISRAREKLGSIKGMQQQLNNVNGALTSSQSKHWTEARRKELSELKAILESKLREKKKEENERKTNNGKKK